MWLLLLRRRRCKACPRLVIWPLYLTATRWQTVAAMPTRLCMAASLTIAMHAASSMSPSDPTNNALAYAFEITASLFFSQCHNHGTPFLQLVSQMASSRLLSNMAVSALAATIMPSWAQIKQHMQQVSLLSQAEEFGRRLAHQFPWSPSASVALGLALRRCYLGQVGAPSLAAHRKQIIKVHHHTL